MAPKFMFTTDGPTESIAPMSTVSRTVVVNEPAAGPSMNCGAVGENLCYEDSGQTQWVKVGAGKGNFEVVQQYMPVQGGSFAAVQAPGRVRWSFVSGCVCFIVILVAGIVAIVLASGSRPVEQHVSHTRPASYNCSVGSWTTRLTSDIQIAIKAFAKSEFGKVDVDADGLLSKAEIADAAQKGALPVCFDQTLAHVDVNLDGSVSESEFESALPKEHYESAFVLADTDCDGYLSNIELTNFRSASQLPLQTKALLGAADVDADTKLSKQEFVAAIEKSSLEQGANPAGVAMWTSAKKAWCCQHESLGCETETSAPFDCAANSWGWEKAWSEPKKVYCCRVTGVGCAAPGPKYDCALSYDNWAEAWTEEQKDYCCEREGRGCPVSKPYDCQAGLINAQKGWSGKKKLWCCDNEQLGCPEEPFDCKEKEASWKADWTAGKKAYCCKTQNKGCAVDPNGLEPLYNCRDGFDAWETKWTEGKKEYCCSQYGRGCKETTSPAPRSLPFDCQAGFSNWKAGWSEAKKVWCCDHDGKGCTHDEEFNCYAGYEGSPGSLGWEHTWSDAKKSWCCKNYQRGCATSDPYDCEAGAWNWQKGWSNPKKAWCCEFKSKGCPSHDEVEEMEKHRPKELHYDDCHDDHEEAWDDAKKRWCCLSKNVGCASEPFDCEAGYSNWKAGWSSDKKVWCCREKGKGCEQHLV